jgi:hypothetical protein
MDMRRRRSIVIWPGREWQAICSVGRETNVALEWKAASWNF